MVAYNIYGGYFIPLSSQHRPAAQKVLKGEVYEPDTIKFITANCGSGDIIHAGTYFGDFLPALSSAIPKEYKIWAFEPNPENYKCAQITLLMNDIRNVTLINAALGDSPSGAKMIIESTEGIALGGGSRLLREDEKGKTINVEVVKIDDVIPADRNISILHLDVEGFEKEALQGALKTINRCLPMIIMEDNNNVLNSDWFRKNLLQLGYEVKGNIHNNLLLTV